MITGTFVIYLALEAYFKVETVSSKFVYAGDIVASMIVFAFPPKLSWSSRVSFESLYGTNVPFPLTNVVITLPKAVKERLIFVASMKRSPVEPVLLSLSEPAKSTRLNLEPINFSDPSFFSRDST